MKHETYFFATNIQGALLLTVCRYGITQNIKNHNNAMLECIHRVIKVNQTSCNQIPSSHNHAGQQHPSISNAQLGFCQQLPLLFVFDVP